MSRLSGRLVALATLLAVFVMVLGGFVPPAPSANAHTACEITQHEKWNFPNDVHRSNFNCSGSLNFSCGSVAEVYIQTSFTGFGITDSNGAVRLVLTNVVGGDVNQLVKEWGPTEEVDNRYYRLVSTYHSIRWGSSDGAYFTGPIAGFSDMRIGCMNNTLGQPYFQEGSV